MRIDLPTSAPSAVVATAIAAVLGAARITSVWCGDHSLDRGSGAVPAFLAAELGSAQALGLVDVELDAVGRPRGRAGAGWTEDGASTCDWTAPVSCRSRARRLASAAPRSGR